LKEKRTMKDDVWIIKEGQFITKEFADSTPTKEEIEAAKQSSTAADTRE
jgi:hypothetical protein